MTADTTTPTTPDVAQAALGSNLDDDVKSVLDRPDAKRFLLVIQEDDKGLHIFGIAQPGDMDPASAPARIASVIIGSIPQILTAAGIQPKGGTTLLDGDRERTIIMPAGHA